MEQKTLSETEIKILAKTLKLIAGLYNDKIISGRNTSLKSVVAKPEMLTAREIKIIKLICQEYSTKEIATELEISHRTVEGLREKILQKTKSKSTIGLVKYAVRKGIYTIK